MARDFSELARVWVETYGKDIRRLPRDKLVEIANQCITADMVPYMDPVRPEEEMYIEAALMAALDEGALAKAKADAKMPQLIGTEKQVRWANIIRKDAIAAARLFRQRAMLEREEITSMRLTVYEEEVLHKVSNAIWFIDNRIEFAGFPKIIKGITRKTPLDQIIPMSEAEEEARTEMTILPNSNKQMGVAEISVSDGLLTMFMRDLDFLKIARSHNLNWDPDVLGWRRKIDGHGETTSDQIAGLAVALLAEGFTVMVSDDEARGKAQADANEL